MRTYKNGITGKRYKEMYIVKTGKKEFDVLDEEKNMVITGMPSADDCKWEIDKMFFSSALLELLYNLYAKDTYIINNVHKEALKRATENPDQPNYQRACDVIYTVLYRKINNKPF